MSKTTYKPFIPFSKMEENAEVVSQQEPLTPEPATIPAATPVQDCTSKILFIHDATENEESSSKVVDMVKEKVAGCDIKDIHLYELNIQPLSQKDPKDGMSQIYAAMEQSDIIIFTMGTEESEALEIVIKRITNKYSENQALQFKCFSAIVIGEDTTKVKDNLLDLAYTLGMIVTPQSIIIASNDFKETDIMTQIDLAGIKMTQITSKTADLRTTADNTVEDSEGPELDTHVDTLDEFLKKSSGDSQDVEQPETESDPIDTTTDDPAPGETEDAMEEGSEDEDTTTEELEENVFSFEEWKTRNKPISESVKNLNIDDFISLYSKKYFDGPNDLEIL